MISKFKKKDKPARRKTIRTKLLRVPIALVILSVFAIIISVTYRTYTGMRQQMRDDSEFLLENIVSRVNDNSSSIESIETLIDSRLEESLAAV